MKITVEQRVVDGGDGRGDMIDAQDWNDDWIKLSDEATSGVYDPDELIEALRNLPCNYGLRFVWSEIASAEIK